MTMAIVIAMVILLVFLLLKRKPKQATIEGPPADWYIPESWSLGRGEYDGKPMITRINRGVDAVMGHSLYSKQLGIAVPFNQPSADGLPDRNEQKILYRIEDWIRNELTVGKQSLFVGVITTSGMREFVLYTSDEEAATAKIRELAERTTTHEVQFVVNEDADWEVFKKLSGQKRAAES